MGVSLVISCVDNFCAQVTYLAHQKPSHVREACSVATFLASDSRRAREDCADLVRDVRQVIALASEKP